MSRSNRKSFLNARTSSTTGHPAGQAGFTLIEILVAITILSIGLMGIASMMATSIKGGAFGRRTTVSENLAIQKLEQFKNLDYTFVKKLAESPATPGATRNLEQCPGAGGCVTGFKCVANLATDCPPEKQKKDPTCIQSPVANEEISTEVEDYGQVAGYLEFKRVTVVRAFNGCPIAALTDGLARVTVAVSWKGSQPTGQIQEHSVQVGTFVAK